MLQPQKCISQTFVACIATCRQALGYSAFIKNLHNGLQIRASGFYCSTDC